MIISNLIFYLLGIKTIPTHNMLFTEMYLQIGVWNLLIFLKQKMQNYQLSDAENNFCPFK